VTRLRWASWASVVLAAGVSFGACGGKSAEDVRAERASFVRKADPVCEKASADLARGEQPRNYTTLGARLQRDQKTLRTAVSDLHGLHKELGDSVSPQIVAFDRRADGVLAAAKPIGEHIELADSSAARRSAERLRRAYAELYDAAGKARLRQCGRGGNRAADTVLFTVYRSEYIIVNSDVNLRLRFLDEDPQSFEAFRRNLRRSLKLVVNYRKRMGRLAPPKKVQRRRHRLLLRRTTQALGSARRLLAIANRGQAAVATGGARSLALRVVRQADLADAVDRSIRRVLRSPGSRRRTPSPDTNSA
jgi:hypothetical protein